MNLYATQLSITLVVKVIKTVANTADTHSDLTSWLNET